MNQAFENMTIKQLRELTEQYLKDNVVFENNTHGVEKFLPSLSNSCPKSNLTAEELIEELEDETR